MVKVARYRRQEPPGLILLVILSSLVLLGFFYKEENFRKKIQTTVLPSKLLGFVQQYISIAIKLISRFFPNSPGLPINTTEEIVLPNEASYSWSLDHNVVGQVERVEWSPHIPFVKEVNIFNSISKMKLIKLREPVILTNTIVSHWKAIELWNTPGYLASHPVLISLSFLMVG